MAKTAAGLNSLRECITKARGPIPQSCIECELSRIIVPINMYQTDADLVVKAFLHGVQPGEVDTSITKDTIRIKGEHKEKPDIREDDYLCKEQPYGAFDRVLTIPTPVQTDKARVTFDDGILTLTLPKAKNTEKGKRRAVKKR
jgi:HSP20 family protein